MAISSSVPRINSASGQDCLFLDGRKWLQLRPGLLRLASGISQPCKLCNKQVKWLKARCRKNMWTCYLDHGETFRCEKQGSSDQQIGPLDSLYLSLYLCPSLLTRPGDRLCSQTIKRTEIKWLLIYSKNGSHYVPALCCSNGFANRWTVRFTKPHESRD